MTDQLKTIKLGAGTCDALASADTLPTELPLFKLGANPSDVGDIIVDEVSLAALQKQVDGKSFARILIDFEHSSEPGTPNYIPPPRLHAGYGDLVPLAGRGVNIGNIKWTKSGEKYAREYADLSPTVKLSKDNHVTFVKSVALCPNGAVHDLTFLSAKPDNDPIEEEIVAMDDIKTLSATVETQKQTISTLAATVESQKTELAKIVTLSSSVETLTADVGVLKADILKRDKQAVIAAAARDGKVVALSAEAIDKLSVEDLRAHVEKITPTVPLSARTPRAMRGDQGADALLAEYNGIQDPQKRAAFWGENRKKMFGDN